MPILAKKKSPFQMKFILNLEGMYTSKIVAFRAQNTRTLTLKSRRTQNKRVTVWCEFWSRGIIGHFLRKWNVIGPCYSQKLKRRILATISFNRTALRATQPKLHSLFWALFLKIALTAVELMSLGHLGAAISHRWTIICGVPSKISVTPWSHWWNTAANNR